ncbi:MAG: alpha/beta fold hydrolase [Pseudomonadota bacterium]|nr:alpha/beta fold hydrolase [Pseudomonadota bacterium]
MLSTEDVEQLTHDGVSVHLRKERLLIDERIAIVRKRLLGLQGPRVVLVHGFAQNRYSWHLSRRSLSAWLAGEGFDVYNLELPGHGNSRSPAGSARFADYVVDVRRVAEVLGEPAFWIGHSLGGAVVYAGATVTPMRGVVGIGALFQFAQANRALKLLCQLSGKVQGRTDPRPNRLGALNVRTQLAGRLLAKLYSVSDIAGYAFPISGWAPGSMEEDLLRERLKLGFDWTSANVWFDMARWGATGRFDFEEAWEKTDVPLLVVGGDLDHLMLPDDARTAYDRSGSSDRTWALMDDYGTGVHWGHLDLLLGRHAPTHTWPLLQSWLAAR